MNIQKDSTGKQKISYRRYICKHLMLFFIILIHELIRKKEYQN
nr:MAG TPA: hypothetical protein [Caudoviricetes sp.]